MSPADIDATGPLDDVDETVLAAMARMYAAADPVPAGLVDDVKFAMTVAALHAEVAELQRVGAPELALRSEEYARTDTVSFTTEHLSATLTTTPTSDRHSRLDGWLSGVDVARVELRGPSGVRSIAPSEGGFVFDQVPHGLVQLVVFPSDPSYSPVITPHLEI